MSDSAHATAHDFDPAADTTPPPPAAAAPAKASPQALGWKTRRAKKPAPKRHTGAAKAAPKAAPAPAPVVSPVERYAERLERRLAVADALGKLDEAERAEVFAAVGIK